MSYFPHLHSFASGHHFLGDLPLVLSAQKAETRGPTFFFLATMNYFYWILSTPINTDTKLQKILPANTYYFLRINELTQSIYQLANQNSQIEIFMAKSQGTWQFG